MASRCFLFAGLYCLALMSGGRPLLAEETIVPAPECAAPETVETVRLVKDGPDVPWDALRVGKFSLVDQLGRPVTNESLRGKPWIANFIFTRCTVSCPLLLKNTYELQRQLEDVDFRIVSITVDPEHDTVDVMKKQSDIFEVDPDRWLFVTGPKDDVYELIREGFKQPAWKDVTAADGMQFAHSNNLIHVDADGVIVGKYDSHVEADLITLGQVLKGRIPTPKKHSPVAITTSPPAENVPAPIVRQLPGWVSRLPTTNAMLNTLATLLLLAGYSAIRVKDVRLHKKLMISAFATSTVFLASYLTYHWGLRTYTGSSGKPFEGEGWIRAVYFVLLISHIVLAFVVAIGAPVTLALGLSGKFDTHRRVARLVYPVWLYVSVTGVVIYLMLYHLPR